MKKITLLFLLAITLYACSADAIEESTPQQPTVKKDIKANLGRGDSATDFPESLQ